jgi:aromatic-L-amino-acid decarboxylase
MATNEWMWSADELKRVGYRTVHLIADYLTGLPERPAFRPYPPDRAASSRASTPPG